MADYENNNDLVMTPADEMALMVEGLYKSVSSDLQKMKKEILSELKYSSMQATSLYDSMQKDAAEAAEQTVAAVDSVADKTAEAVGSVAGEMKYVYQQNQAIYEDITSIIADDVIARIEALEETLKEMAAKFENTDYEEVSELVKDKVVESMPVYEEIDYDKISDSVSEKTEAAIAEQNQQVLSAVAAIPVAENVDYSRIVEEVGDRVLEILREEKQVAETAEVVDEEEKVEQNPFDYDRVAYGTAEKVIESLPYQDKIDYDRIAAMVKEPLDYATMAEKVVEKMAKEDDYSYEVVIDGENIDRIGQAVTEGLDAEAISEKIAEKVTIPEIDYDRLAEAVVGKIEVPQMEIDYERLADLVVSKMATPVAAAPEVDYDRLAELVAQKTVIPAVELDYDAIAEKVADKVVIPAPEAKEVTTEETYEILVDEEGCEKIAEKVAEKLDLSNVKIEVLSEVAPAEEVVEETTEVVEEPAVEETPEEPVQEEVVEEPVVEETPVQEEVAVASEPTYTPNENELVDAETGLVIRLKRSFTAKMKQSEDDVKSYYSAIKNEFLSYKKVNAHISWHGERFNVGRDTIAKVNITGKTLCLYLALDPKSEEFKQTVYHQKDVTGQKAYEGTEFMVKIKSGAALKKALRLVAAVAEKVEVVKDEEFVPVKYEEEFAYETTMKLLEDGLIRSTKEKKVALDF